MPKTQFERVKPLDTNLQEITSEQTKIQAEFCQYLVDDGKAERTVQSYVTVYSISWPIYWEETLKDHLS